MDAEEFIRRLEEDSQTSGRVSAGDQSDDIEDDDTPRHQKISLEEAATKAHRIHQKQQQRIAANLELEELRAIRGMNS
jgi:hypothetical protein